MGGVQTHIKRANETCWGSRRGKGGVHNLLTCKSGERAGVVSLPEVRFMKSTGRVEGVRK